MFERCYLRICVGVAMKVEECSHTSQPYIERTSITTRVARAVVHRTSTARAKPAFPDGAKTSREAARVCRVTTARATRVVIDVLWLFMIRNGSHVFGNPPSNLFRGKAVGVGWVETSLDFLFPSSK